MSVPRQEIPEQVRQARDAETAHLDAVMKTHGAAYLRLAVLMDNIKANSTGSEWPLELKALPGEQPSLWLDLAHAITMEPDAHTYRLTHFGQNERYVLLETQEQQEVISAVRRIKAHTGVVAARAANAAQKSWAVATLVYVWLTGIVTGAAGLALILIYMKKQVF